MSDAQQPDPNASTPQPPPYNPAAYPAPPAYGAPGAPTPPPYDPAGTPPPGSAFNVFGLISLILGVVGLGLAFIPVVDFVSGIIPVVGVVLGIIGLVIKKYKKPLALAGLIVSAIAAVVSLVMAIVYIVGFASAASETADDYSGLSSEPGKEVSVVLTVESSEATGDVSYSATDTDDSDYQSGQQSLPFTKEYTTTVGGDFDFSAFSVSADLGEVADDATISCSITVDGEVVDQESQTGSYAFASCDWSSTGSTDDSTDSGSDG